VNIVIFFLDNTVVAIPSLLLVYNISTGIHLSNG